MDRPRVSSRELDALLHHTASQDVSTWSVPKVPQGGSLPARRGTQLRQGI
jgi:hypothetical protein